MAKRPRLIVVNDDTEDAPGSRRRRHGRQDARGAAGRREQPQPYAKEVRPKGPGQARLVDALAVSPVTCAIGPAGTGKTHVAIRTAVALLREGRVKRVVLSRPAVEAGERLGFLPGGPDEKMEPYMRPLYDELLTCVPPQQIKAWLAERVLEIAPIGFMRGRTFADCAVVVDEAQNMTLPQLKMVVSRLGFGSTMILTGDPDQTDLEDGSSGLLPFLERVEGRVPGIAVVRLDGGDIVRHPVVRAMLEVLAEAA